MNKPQPFRYKKGPVSVSVQKVINYPYHWDDSCIEIVMVLEGSIFLERSLDPYCLTPFTMKKHNIFAIALDETHRIYSDDKDNVVLVLQIDTEFIRQHFAKITTLEFETLLDFENDPADREKLEYVKQLAIYLALLVTDPQKDHTIEIERITKEFLYHLIYDYNKINRALSKNKDSEKYLNRILSIAEYHIKNYNQKNLIQDIAKREHLNPVFLSHVLKQYFDYSWQEFVNYYKVEHAIKMLLDTDKNISEITYDCGFSAPRYLYKSFNWRLSKNPNDFRKKYQKDYQNIKYIICYEEVENVDSYLKPHYKNLIEKNIEWLKIDASSQGLPFTLNWKSYLNVLNANVLSQAESQKYLQYIQKEIGFQYIRLFDLFINEIHTFNNRDTDGELYFNWYNVDQILHFITQAGSHPLIVLDISPTNIELYQELIRYFLSHCEREFGNTIIREWAFEIDHNLEASDLINIIKQFTENIFDKENNSLKYPPNPLVNTIYMATYTIKEGLQNNNIDFLQALDSPSNKNTLQSGLITENGLFKPTFHACSLLSLLGDELIEKGDYYIVTKKKDSLQILLYNHVEISNIINEDDFYCDYVGNKDYLNRINIFLKNINGSYKVIRYELNNEYGSVYFHLRPIEKHYLNTYDINLLNKISIPRVTMDNVKGTDITFNVNLQPYSIELITLEMIK